MKLYAHKTCKIEAIDFSNSTSQLWIKQTNPKLIKSSLSLLKLSVLNLQGTSSTHYSSMNLLLLTLDYRLNAYQTDTTVSKDLHQLMYLHAVAKSKNRKAKAKTRLRLLEMYKIGAILR